MLRSSSSSRISSGPVCDGGELAGAGVGDEHVGGFLRVGLGVADQADRAALDPAGDVELVLKAGVVLDGLQNVAAVVRDDVALHVEGHAVDGLGAVAHRVVDLLDRPVGELAGARDAAVAVQLLALGAEAGDGAGVVGKHLDRLFEEVDVDFVRRVVRLAHGVLLQDLAVQVDGLVGTADFLAGGVVINVLRVHEHLDGVGEVHLAQLLRGELGLRGATAAEHVDRLRLVVLQGLVHVVRDLGDQELVAGLGQDAGDVECDAVTDQPEGGGHLLEEVDVDVVLVVAEEEVGGVNTGGAGADGGDT